MIHREGYFIIFSSLIIYVLLALLVHFQVTNPYLRYILFLAFTFVFFAILQFFRNPKRGLEQRESKGIYAPVDGKVVTIETVFEKEYYKADCQMISIFMSPLNVHVTRYPISGEITYSKYHEGKYLVAWHPKSSEENERTTVVMQNSYGTLMYRQISGYVARRIVNYAKVGNRVTIGEDSGFIKFGSRVDVFLPLDAKIEIEINQKTIGSETKIASFI